MTVHMVQFNDCGKSYKTIENAKKQIQKFADQFESMFKHEPKFGGMRCGISARDDGRFVPYVIYSSIESIPGATTFAIHNKFGVCLLG